MFTKEQFLAGAAHALMHAVMGAKRSATVSTGGIAAKSASFSIPSKGATISANESGGVWTVSCDQTSLKVMGDDKSLVDWTWNVK